MKMQSNGKFKQNAMKRITSVGHKIYNFSLYPRFPGELDPYNVHIAKIIYRKLCYLFLAFIDLDEKRR